MDSHSRGHCQDSAGDPPVSSSSALPLGTPFMYQMLRDMGLHSTANALCAELETQRRQKRQGDGGNKGNQSEVLPKESHSPSTSFDFDDDQPHQESSRDMTDPDTANCSGHIVPPSLLPVLRESDSSENSITDILKTLIGFVTAPIETLSKSESSTHIVDEEELLKALGSLYEVMVRAVHHSKVGDDDYMQNVNRRHYQIRTIFLQYCSIVSVQLLLAETVSLHDIHFHKDTANALRPLNDSNRVESKGRKRGRRRENSTAEEQADAALAHTYAHLAKPTGALMHAAKLHSCLCALHKALVSSARQGHVLSSTPAPACAHDLVRAMALVIPTWLEKSALVVQWTMHRVAHQQLGDAAHSEEAYHSSGNVLTEEALPRETQSVLDAIFAGADQPANTQGPSSSYASSSPVATDYQDIAEETKSTFTRLLHVAGRARLLVWIMQSMEECVMAPESSQTQLNASSTTNDFVTVNSVLTAVESQWAAGCAHRLQLCLLNADTFLSSHLQRTQEGSQQARGRRARQTHKQPQYSTLHCEELSLMWTRRVTRLKELFSLFASQLLLGGNTDQYLTGDNGQSQLQGWMRNRSMLCSQFLGTFTQASNEVNHHNTDSSPWSTRSSPSAPSLLSTYGETSPVSKLLVAQCYANYAATADGAKRAPASSPQPMPTTSGGEASRSEDNVAPHHLPAGGAVAVVSNAQAAANLLAVKQSLALGKLVEEGGAHVPHHVPLRQRLRRALAKQSILLDLQSGWMPTVLQLRALQHASVLRLSIGKKRRVPHPTTVPTDTSDAAAAGSDEYKADFDELDDEDRDGDQSSADSISEHSHLSEAVRLTTDGETFVSGEALTPNDAPVSLPAMVGAGSIPSALQSPLHRRGMPAAAAAAAATRGDSSAARGPVAVARLLAQDISAAIERVIFATDAEQSHDGDSSDASNAAEEEEAIDDEGGSAGLHAQGTAVEEDEEEEELSSSDDVFDDPADEVKEEVQQVKVTSDGQLLAFVTTRGRLVAFALRFAPEDDVYEEELLIDALIPGTPAKPHWYEICSAIVEFSNDHRFLLASVQYASAAVPEGREKDRDAWNSTGRMCVYSLHRESHRRLKQRGASSQAAASSVGRRANVPGWNASCDAAESAIAHIFPLSNRLFGNFLGHEAPVMMARWADPRFWGGGWTSSDDLMAMSMAMPAPGGRTEEEEEREKDWRVAARARLSFFQCISAGLDQKLIRWLPMSGVILQEVVTLPLQDLVVSHLMSAVYTIDDTGKLSMYDAWNESHDKHMSDPLQATRVGERGLPLVHAHLRTSSEAVDQMQRLQQPEVLTDATLPRAYFSGNRVVQFDRSDVLPQTVACASSINAAKHSDASSDDALLANKVLRRIIQRTAIDIPSTASSAAARLGRRLIQEVLSERIAEHRQNRTVLLEPSGEEDMDEKESVSSDGTSSVGSPRAEGCDGQYIRYKSGLRLVFSEIERALCHSGGIKRPLSDSTIGPGSSPYRLLSMNLSGEPRWNSSTDGSSYTNRVRMWLHATQAGTAGVDANSNARRDAHEKAVAQIVTSVRFYADGGQVTVDDELFHSLRTAHHNRATTPILSPTASNGRYLCLMAAVGSCRTFTERKKPLELLPGMYACLVFDTFTSHVVRVIPVCPVQPTPSLSHNSVVSSHHNAIKSPIFSLQCSVAVISGSGRNAPVQGSPSNPFELPDTTTPSKTEGETVLVAVGAIHDSVYYYNAITGDCIRSVALNNNNNNQGAMPTEQATAQSSSQGSPLGQEKGGDATPSSAGTPTATAAAYAAAKDVLASWTRGGRPSTPTTGMSTKVPWWIPAADAPRDADEENVIIAGAHAESSRWYGAANSPRARRMKMVDQLVARFGPAVVMQGNLEVVRVIPSHNEEYICGRPNPGTGSILHADNSMHTVSYDHNNNNSSTNNNKSLQSRPLPYATFMSLMSAYKPNRRASCKRSSTLAFRQRLKHAAALGVASRGHVAYAVEPFQLAALQQEEVQRALTHVVQQHTPATGTGRESTPMEMNQNRPSPLSVSSISSFLPSFLQAHTAQQDQQQQEQQQRPNATRSSQRVPLHCGVVNALAIWVTPPHMRAMGDGGDDAPITSFSSAFYTVAGNESGKLLLLGGSLGQ